MLYHISTATAARPMQGGTTVAILCVDVDPLLLQQCGDGLEPPIAACIVQGCTATPIHAIHLGSPLQQGGHPHPFAAIVYVAPSYSVNEGTLVRVAFLDFEARIHLCVGACACLCVRVRVRVCVCVRN
jgi:hypothetical protein